MLASNVGTAGYICQNPSHQIPKTQNGSDAAPWIPGAKPSCPSPSELVLISFLQMTSLRDPLKDKGNNTERTQLMGTVNLPVHQTLLSPHFCTVTGDPIENIFLNRGP